MAHIDAGKTTTTERILYYTGKSYKIGEVHEAPPPWTGWSRSRSAASPSRPRDDLLLARRRWQGPRAPHQHHRHAGPRRLHHRVERSLRVLDGAVACFDGVAGVEPQSETVWRQAEKYHVPRMCFVNKLDRTGANFERCVDMIKDRLGARPAVLYLPIGIEEASRAWSTWSRTARSSGSTSLGAKFVLKRFRPTWPTPPRPLADLIEMAVEQDDEVMEHYLEGTEPDTATLKKLIRKGTLNFSFVPVLCGSAFKNKGVQPLLDAVIDYLPSPLDIPPVKGLKMDGVTTDTRAPSDDAPFSALAFKIMNDPFVGTLTFAHLLGQARDRVAGHQLRQGQEGKGRPHAADACQRP